jgi:hypothetical protein
MTYPHVYIYCVINGIINCEAYDVTLPLDFFSLMDSATKANDKNNKYHCRITVIITIIIINLNMYILFVIKSQYLIFEVIIYVDIL